VRLFAAILLFTAIISAEQIKIPVSFSAKFTQKITNPNKHIIHYSGTIRLNRSGALKWQYQKPTKKEVCSDGNSLTIVDHDLEQVSFYRLNKTLDLVKILKKAKHHKDNIYVANYQDMLYTFSLDKAGRIDQIAYKDTLENTVNIHFHAMHYNTKAYPQSKMQCPYPPAYDIVNG